MSIEKRNELRARYGTMPPAASATPVQPVEPAIDAPPAGTGLALERAFVVTAESGRTVITAPVRQVAAANDGFMYLNGRFVEADTPNGNNALWTTQDLELGQPTVAGGPLNWLHQERKIIGTLLDGTLVESDREAAGGGGIGNHIVSNAVLWEFLFPQEALSVQRAAEQDSLFFSMECLSREVMCVSGCGESFSYADYNANRACAHLRERSNVRRFVDPLFLGGAIIVPPVQPGWSRANVDVLGKEDLRQAAALTERYDLTTEGLSKGDAEAMVGQILAWANRA